jgi:Sporulation and spore germination.
VGSQLRLRRGTPASRRLAKRGGATQANAGFSPPGEKLLTVRRALLAVAIAGVAAGCGGERQVPAQPRVTTSLPPTVSTTTPLARPTSLELFFLAPDGKLVAAARDVAHTQTPGAATLTELTNAPSGATTQVPGSLQLTIDHGAAHVTGASLDDAALAQIVYSLTSFPTVKSVNGKTRADVEDFAPAILVVNPSPGEAVTSPIA